MVNFACVEEVSILEGTGERWAGGRGPMAGAQTRDFPRGTGQHTLTYMGPRWQHLLALRSPTSSGWLRLTPCLSPLPPHEAASATCTAGGASENPPSRVLLCTGKHPLRWHRSTLSYSAMCYGMSYHGVPMFRCPHQSYGVKWVWYTIISEFISYSVLCNWSLNTLLTYSGQKKVGCKWRDTTVQSH